MREANPDSTQYTAIRYGDRLAEAGMTASINAMAESLIGLYKSECVRRDGRYAPSRTSSS